MDFIERLFGVAPDGGDGSTEMLYVAVAIGIVAAAAARSLARRRAPNRRR
ncbi:hypothetical protein RFM99_32665 [Mesorhizobium sp. VK4C]|nr:hypothetical protein [Mesorhizobium sp. VK4C]MDX8503118.1 hypothetical protein [Mesorhizobium sp. VK4C]